nr:MAG TPA: hypothetical protein [Caudoviricetes sp.]
MVRLKQSKPNTAPGGSKGQMRHCKAVSSLVR